MDSLDYKYKNASKQKRIIALQDNRQMPTQQAIWKVSAKASL